MKNFLKQIDIERKKMKKLVNIVVEVDVCNDTSDLEISSKLSIELHDFVQDLKSMHSLYTQFPEMYKAYPNEEKYEYTYDDFFHRKLLDVNLISTSIKND